MGARRYRKTLVHLNVQKYWPWSKCCHSRMCWKSVVITRSPGHSSLKMCKWNQSLSGDTGDILDVSPFYHWKWHLSEWVYVFLHVMQDRQYMPIHHEWTTLHSTPLQPINRMQQHLLRIILLTCFGFTHGSNITTPSTSQKQLGPRWASMCTTHVWGTQVENQNSKRFQDLMRKNVSMVLVACPNTSQYHFGWFEVRLDGGITCDGFTSRGWKTRRLPSRVKNHCIETLAMWYKGYWGKLQLEMMRYLRNVSWRGNPNP